LNINDTAYRKIIIFTNATKITTGKYLVKTKCKWETKVRRGDPPPPRLAGSKNVK
jgi:hypothetical protein